MKLFLYSLQLSKQQCLALNELTGKPAGDTTVAIIENAADVIPDSEDWVRGVRGGIENFGYQAEPVDLKSYRGKSLQLKEKLSSKDVLWLGGGHTYYLRWILKETGADDIIADLVHQGKVLAGWSAGAIAAGPTTKHFDRMGDDPAGAPGLVETGLRLTDMVVVPHIDNLDFAKGAQKAKQLLMADGYQVQPLSDTQVLVINGSTHKII